METGDKPPTVADFILYVRFSSGTSYGIVQEKKTSNITLRLRKISNSIYHFTANIPTNFRGARVFFRKVEGNVNVTMGSPTVINTTGALVIDEPKYEAVQIDNNSIGNVGIGTTTPDSKLTVKGNIHAEEVKVDLSVPGPDYVFKENYDLRSLEEVQNYIKEHGHLPNIPSAKEMETNGIQLGKMNMRLLEKIEELTLYVIQLKKENQNQIIQLKKEINEFKKNHK